MYQQTAFEIGRRSTKQEPANDYRHVRRKPRMKKCDGDGVALSLTVYSVRMDFVNFRLRHPQQLQLSIQRQQVTQVRLAGL